MPLNTAELVDKAMFMVYVESAYDDANFPGQQERYDLRADPESLANWEMRHEAARKRYRLLSEVCSNEVAASLNTIPDLTIEKRGHDSFLVWCSRDDVGMVRCLPRVSYVGEITLSMPTKLELEQPRLVVALPWHLFENIVLETLGLDPEEFEWNSVCDYEWNNDSDYSTKPAAMPDRETLEFVRELEGRVWAPLDSKHYGKHELEGLPGAAELLGLAVVKGVIPDAEYIIRVCW